MSIGRDLRQMPAPRRGMRQNNARITQIAERSAPRRMERRIVEVRQLVVASANMLDRSGQGRTHRTRVDHQIIKTLIYAGCSGSAASITRTWLSDWASRIIVAIHNDRRHGYPARVSICRLRGQSRQHRHRKNNDDCDHLSNKAQHLVRPYRNGVDQRHLGRIHSVLL